MACEAETTKSESPNAKAFVLTHFNCAPTLIPPAELVDSVRPIPDVADAFTLSKTHTLYQYLYSLEKQFQ